MLRPDMLNKKILSINLLFLFVFFLSHKTLAQDSLDPVREAFYQWGKTLRDTQNFETSFKIEGKTSLILQLFDNLNVLTGRLSYRLKDNAVEIKTDSPLGSYQLNLYNDHGYELMTLVGVAPKFSFYRSISSTKLSMMLNCFKALKDSEVAFYACFDSKFKISLKSASPEIHKIFMESKKADEIGIDSMTLEILPKSAFPKKISLQVKGQNPEQLYFNNFQKAPALKNKRFSIPWPPDAEIRAYE